MNEHDRSILREHHVRSPGQISLVQPVAEPEREERLAEQDLGLRIASGDTRHAPSPLLRR
jgi:hypothetical protein